MDCRVKPGNDERERTKSKREAERRQTRIQPSATSDIALVAVFPQNYLTNVQKGDAVEVVLDPYPGRIFTAKVDHVIAATGGGQFAPSGTIPNAASMGSDGLYAVRINFDDAAVARNLSLGSGGTAAIYTTHGPV
jgi:membrane fusion protein, multidrug efflux system